MTIIHDMTRQAELEAENGRLVHRLRMAEQQIEVTREFLRRGAALDFPRRPDILPDAGHHEKDCWRYHRDCLAVRALQLLGE